MYQLKKKKKGVFSILTHYQPSTGFNSNIKISQNFPDSYSLLRIVLRL